MIETSSPILIIGTGAMACLFAARFSAAGTPVVMTGSWQAGLNALNEFGVRLVHLDGREQAYPVKVMRSVDECYQPQYALVLVKSWQTEAAAQRLAGCLAENGLALSLQNGLGNREALAQVLGAPRVALGMTTSGATLLGPGRVLPAGEGPVVLDGTPQVADLGSLLHRAGFQVDFVNDTNSLLWGKLVINAAINPLTAVLRVPNGELLAHTEARAIMATLASEAAAVAHALQIELPYPDPVVAAEAIAQRTAMNRSSMLQDVLRGARTEIDAICGEIVRLGERTGVPVPVNRVFWQLVKALEAKPDHS